MPTANPRVTVTLSPASYAVLQSISITTKQSMSAVMADLVDVAVPMFNRINAAAVALEKAQAHGIEKMGKSLEEGQRRVEEILGVALHDLDEATLPLFEFVESVDRRAGRAAPDPARSTGSGVARRVSKRAVTPRPVTRGVGTSPKSSKAS